MPAKRARTEAAAEQQRSGAAPRHPFRKGRPQLHDQRKYQLEAFRSSTLGRLFSEAVAEAAASKDYYWSPGTEQSDEKDGDAVSIGIPQKWDLSGDNVEYVMQCFDRAMHATMQEIGFKDELTVLVDMPVDGTQSTPALREMCGVTHAAARGANIQLGVKAKGESEGTPIGVLHVDPDKLTGVTCVARTDDSGAVKKTLAGMRGAMQRREAYTRQRRQETQERWRQASAVTRARGVSVAMSDATQSHAAPSELDVAIFGDASDNDSLAGALGGIE
eukprot:TRINITY_DN36519_c0_g1_i1.p1 TRINITY_DN36519_c0_g1~~TRINITY_DN36519_c0_g1_i1.p1  ORF type:complete len:275 (+),score=70.10 TRINITY_DN36519_c0_g1_i1:69-893(+)